MELAYMENVLKKANKRVYYVHYQEFKKSRLSPSSMLLAYNCVLRPLVLYAYPCCCNLPAYLQDKLLKFERRIFRVVGATNDMSVIEAGDSFCQHLFNKVSSSSNHCLLKCFTRRLTNTRQSLKLQSKPKLLDYHVLLLDLLDK